MEKQLKMVKCLACGEIFPEGAEICPVCGVDSSNFIILEDEKAIVSEDTAEIYLIIGGGIASVSAALAIRERNKTASVVILTKEKTYPIMRPMLTKKLMSDFKISELYVKSGKFYEDNNILILTDREIDKILPEKRNVVLQDGSVFMYDKLIYAAGASPFVPSFKGADKKGVAVIRDYDDFANIKQYSEKLKNAVIIGGGVLGLEAASAIRKAGKKVTVIESSERVMSKQLDEETSIFIQNKAEKFGVNIVFNAKIEEITGNEYADGVMLEGGEKIKAELVILSCGVRANIKLAANAGILTDRAVIVDKYMETNIKGIFACGDCAEFNKTNYALWSQAISMGKIAGINASGGFAAYEEQNFPLAFNGFDTSLYVLGNIKGKEIKTVNEKGFEKKYYDKEKLVGFILAGDIKKSAEYTNELSR